MFTYNWRTFDNRLITLSTTTHQHISNLYWFHKIIFNHTETELEKFMSVIQEKHEGVLLPYRPCLRFFPEINFLINKGLLKLIEFNNHYEINFNNVVVGYIKPDTEEEKELMKIIGI